MCGDETESRQRHGMSRPERFGQSLEGTEKDDDEEGRERVHARLEAVVKNEGIEEKTSVPRSASTSPDDRRNEAQSTRQAPTKLAKGTIRSTASGSRWIVSPIVPTAAERGVGGRRRRNC